MKYINLSVIPSLKVCGINMGRVRKHTSVWLKPELFEQIDILAKFMDKSRSQIMEEMIGRGILITGYQQMIIKMKADLDARWKANNANLPAFEIFNINLIIKRDNEMCQKCKSKENLLVYHINRNQTDFKINNLITLCRNCTAKAEAFIAPQYIEASFIVWFNLMPI